MEVRDCGPLSELLVIAVVGIAEIYLGEQHGDNNDAQDLMCVVESVKFGIDNAHGNSTDQAKETYRASGYLENPMELERAEPPEKDHPKGEQEKKGAGETNCMDDDQSGKGAWQWCCIRVGRSGNVGSGRR